MQLLSKIFKKFEKKKGGRIIKDWDFLADDIITTNPAVSKDNSTIVFGTKNGKIYSLDHNGKVRWVHSIKKKLAKEVKQVLIYIGGLK